VAHGPQGLPLAHPGPAVDDGEQRAVLRRAGSRCVDEDRFLGQDRVGADERDVLGPGLRQPVEPVHVGREAGGRALEGHGDVDDDVRQPAARGHVAEASESSVEVA
jgi:hypothetical protein